MKNFRRYPPNPRVQWRHDAWTLNKILQRYKKPKEKQILHALVHLRAGVSYTRTALLVKIKRSNLLWLAKTYNKSGLQELVPAPISINSVARRRIEQFLKDHPDQRKSLLSGDDLMLYSEWADVDEEMLVAWIKETEYYGESNV